MLPTRPTSASPTADQGGRQADARPEPGRPTARRARLSARPPPARAVRARRRWSGGPVAPRPRVRPGGRLAEPAVDVAGPPFADDCRIVADALSPGLHPRLAPRAQIIVAARHRRILSVVGQQRDRHPSTEVENFRVGRSRRPCGPSRFARTVQEKEMVPEFDLGRQLGYIAVLKPRRTTYRNRRKKEHGLALRDRRPVADDIIRGRVHGPPRVAGWHGPCMFSYLPRGWLTCFSRMIREADRLEFVHRWNRRCSGTGRSAFECGSR